MKKRTSTSRHRDSGQGSGNRANSKRQTTEQRRRLARFETLEPREMMTASGWESASHKMPFPEQLADITPEFEQHALLDGPSTDSLIERMEAAFHSIQHACEYLSIQDYEGNLLPNWQGLVSEEGILHDHMEDGATGGEYSLWNGKWPQAGGLGTAVTITYSYSNALDGSIQGVTTTQIKAGIEKVLQLWSTYAPLNFVEVVDSGPASGDTGYSAGSTPNLRIGHHWIDGGSQVLAHAYYPQGTQGLSGDVHFDVGDTWRIGAGQGGIDFVEVALHEIGHALGLQHENTNTAIMNPYYGGRFANLNAAYLLQDDINGIRALYGTGTGSVTPITPNNLPTLAAISDVSMSRSQGSVDIALTVNDADGDNVTLTATATQQDQVATLAYQLDQQYGFSLSATDYYNYRGASEKYFTGSNGQWYFITPNGSVYSFNTTIADSTLVGTLNATYYANTSLLCNATAPTATAFNDAVLSFNGNTLTVDPANSFTGTFQVTVSASDGQATVNRNFSVTVNNQTPTLAAISDQSMNPSTDSINVALSFADADSDSLTVTASVVEADVVAATAYDLDQQYRFTSEVTQFYNLRGAGEKYLQDSGGNWYFILANGRVYSWNGSIAGSPLIGQLDSRFHSNASLLYNAQPQTGGAPSGVGLSVNGSTLTVNPPNGYTGSFTVTVTVSDGAASTQRSFELSVINHAPTIAAIADQSITPSNPSRTINVSATDADGDSVTYSASAVQVDAAAQLAYTLDQQRDFRAADNDYYNLRGLGERYLNDASGNWYYITPTGELFAWGGSVAASTSLGTLDSTYHTTLTKLFNVQAPSTQAVNAGLSWNGSSLTVTPPNGFTGSFQVTVSATDGSLTSTRSFQVEVINHAPTINAISDQTIAPGGTKAVTITAADVDGDSLSYSASAVQVDALAQAAYDLDQQRGLVYGGTDYLNYRGAGEKYITDASGNWYFILPNGEFYLLNGSIAGSTLLATLDSSYHTTTSLIYNAQAPVTQAINVGLTWNSNTLTVAPPNGFTGSFQVTVTASDGSLTADRSFTVTVANQAPQIAAIANQSMSPTADTLQVALNVSDADGDSLTYTTSASQVDAVAQSAYNLDQQHDFRAGASEFLNYRGANEKYFQDAAGNWNFILPNGSVYRLVNTIQASSLLGELDASYYSDLTKLYNVASPSSVPVNVGLSINNGQLTIDPPANFTGSFQVTVGVSDGQANTQTTFMVTVANQAPTLAAIADQTMSTNQDSIQVAITAADADGDSLTYTATAEQADEVAMVAYNLDQQHGFYTTANEYFNLRGLNEKYLQGNGGAWYYMLPNGQTYQWGGSIAASTLVGTLDGTYYANPNLLIQAQQPTVNSVNVVFSVSNGVLTINPPNGFSGDFNVTLEVSDGTASATRTFSVNVSSNLSAPILADNLAVTSSTSSAILLSANNFTAPRTDVFSAAVGSPQSSTAKILPTESQRPMLSALRSEEGVQQERQTQFSSFRRSANDSRQQPADAEEVVDMQDPDEMEALLDMIYEMLGEQAKQ